MREAPPLGDFSPHLSTIDTANAASAAVAVAACRWLANKHGVRMDSPLMRDLEALRASFKRVGVGPTLDVFPILRGSE